MYYSARTPRNGKVSVLRSQNLGPAHVTLLCDILREKTTASSAVWVSESNITHIRAGGQALVTVSGLAGRQYSATIEWVGVNADPGTGNFPVKLILAGDTDTLRPGMTASAVLDGISIPDALLLPEAALVDRDRRRVVFVVEEGVARIREPLLAAAFSDRLHVLAGLSPGQQVVIEGQQLLLDGTPVRIRSGD